jgi:hypothetical protein
MKIDEMPDIMKAEASWIRKDDGKFMVMLLTDHSSVRMVKRKRTGTERMLL